MFPDGAPGVGLVLLRAMAGTALLFSGSISWMARPEPTVLPAILTALFVACGLSLILGLLTRVFSTLAALISLGIALSLISVGIPEVTAAKLFAVFTCVIATALLCLGPGAYSLDSRRYGRREIIIPATPRSSDASSR